MGSIRNLGPIDLTPAPCGHVGPHERVLNHWSEIEHWIGYPANGAPERCDHWVTKLEPYRRRDHRSTSRVWVDCSCGWDWNDYDEAAALAMWASHRENELTLAAAYLPENVEPPYKDAP